MNSLLERALELKTRYVASSEGERRYGKPIGEEITAEDRERAKDRDRKKPRPRVEKPKPQAEKPGQNLGPDHAGKNKLPAKFDTPADVNKFKIGSLDDVRDIVYNWGDVAPEARAALRDKMKLWAKENDAPDRLWMIINGLGDGDGEHDDGEGSWAAIRDGRLEEWLENREQGRGNRPAREKPTSTTTYTIKPGDTLSELAERNGVTVEEILAANPKIEDPDLIYSGDDLKIPVRKKKPIPDEKHGGVKSLLIRASELKDRVRTPEGAAHYGQPIGSVIRRDAMGNLIPNAASRAATIAAMGSPKTGEPAQRDARVSTTGYTQRMRSKAKDARFSVAQGKGPNSTPPNVKGSKHLWELPSDYDGYDMWVDARNLRMYVAQEDDGMFVAYDVNNEVIEEATDRKELIAKLEKFAAIELKPGCKWATAADRKRLVTPPAWRSVQIPIDQKTTRMKMQGYDSKGKQQTQYTAEQDEIRDAVKFERTKQLQKKMRTLDSYLSKNVGSDNVDCLMMMRRLGMRPDRGDSGADVETFGATSLQAKHVKVTPTGLVTLKFTPGKKKTEVTIKVRDKVLADMLRERLKDKSHSTPLFDVNVDKVEKEFRSVVGQAFNLKDLRTLKANGIALEMIAKRKSSVPGSKAEFNRWRKEVLTAVSDVLGNTPDIVKKSYVNPVVFEQWAVDPTWL